LTQIIAGLSRHKPDGLAIIRQAPFFSKKIRCIAVVVHGCDVIERGLMTTRVRLPHRPFRAADRRLSAPASGRHT
jgi:hypothetical protein